MPVPVRPPLTVNAPPAGAEPASSGSLKVTVSLLPSTLATESAGGVISLPVSEWSKLLTSTPVKDWSRGLAFHLS